MTRPPTAHAQASLAAALAAIPDAARMLRPHPGSTERHATVIQDPGWLAEQIRLRGLIWGIGDRRTLATLWWYSAGSAARTALRRCPRMISAHSPPSCAPPSAPSSAGSSRTCRGHGRCGLSRRTRSPTDSCGRSTRRGSRSRQCRWPHASSPRPAPRCRRHASSAGRCRRERTRKRPRRHACNAARAACCTACPASPRAATARASRRPAAGHPPASQPTRPNRHSPPVKVARTLMPEMLAGLTAVGSSDRTTRSASRPAATVPRVLSAWLA